jgi:transposase
MEQVEIRAVIKFLCKKGMSPKEIHEDFMDTLGKESPSYSTVNNGLLNLRGAGRALEMMSGQKRPPTMKLQKLCTIWSCATEGNTYEALIGKWV